VAYHAQLLIFFLRISLASLAIVTSLL
jgi:hypothetical protein